MTEINLWANKISDYELHHIGEFYTQKYKKPWRRKVDWTYTAGFKKWLLWQNSNQIYALLSDKFEIHRDSEALGFFIKRKRGVP